MAASNEGRIFPTDMLDETGQLFELQTIKAWEHFKRQEITEVSIHTGSSGGWLTLPENAFAISHWLLLQPDISDLHKAYLHLILAHGKDQYCEHGLKALTLFTTCYKNSNPVRAEQIKARADMVDYAKDVYRQNLLNWANHSIKT